MDELASYKKRTDRFLYRVPGIEPEVPFRLDVSAPGFARYLSPPMNIPAGESTFTFNATLAVGGSIHGVIKRADGTSAVAATLKLLRGDEKGFVLAELSDDTPVVAGAEGSFAFTHLPPGRYKIIEEPVGLEGLVFDTEPKQEPLILEENQNLEGAVVVLSAPPAQRYSGGFSPR